MTAADVLVEVLIDWGVDVVFGLPGDGINGMDGEFIGDLKKVAKPTLRRREGLEGLKERSLKNFNPTSFNERG